MKVEPKKAKAEKKEEASSGENIDAEILSLDSARLDTNESVTIYRELYNLLPKDVFLAYDKLQNFARE